MLRSLLIALVLHATLVAIAATLPEPALVRPRSRPIEIEVGPPPRPTPPPPVTPAVTPPKAVEPPPARPEIRTPERTRPAPTTPPPEAPRPEAPPKVAPPEATPPPEPEKRTIASVDLRLKTLPSGASSGGITLPPSEDSHFGSGGTINGQPGRKEWHPRGDVGDPITGKIKEQKEDRFPLARVGRDEYLYKGPQFSARILPDGTVSFDDKAVRDFNGTSGSFDITDAIMRGKKQDPYRHEKQMFMASTQALRDQLQKKARQERLAASMAGLPQHLENVWGDRRIPAKRRRQQLFEIWRDIAMSDDDEGRAGQQARRTIEAFVRSHLPEGSEDAYTEDELAMLNRGQRDRFAPYR